MKGTNCLPVFQPASSVLSVFCFRVFLKKQKTNPGMNPVALGRTHGRVCAGEMPLAGYRVVDAFGYDVRAFVLNCQVCPSGGSV